MAAKPDINSFEKCNIDKSSNNLSDNSDTEAENANAECNRNGISNNIDGDASTNHLTAIDSQLSDLAQEICQLIRIEINLEVKFMKKELVLYYCYKNNISKQLQVKLKEFNRLSDLYKIEVENMLFDAEIS